MFCYGLLPVSPLSLSDQKLICLYRPGLVTDPYLITCNAFARRGINSFLGVLLLILETSDRPDHFAYYFFASSKGNYILDICAAAKVLSRLGTHLWPRALCQVTRVRDVM